MSRYIYHGRAPSHGAWDSAINGKIPGDGYTVYYVDIPPQDEERQYRARDIHSLPGEIVREEEVQIVGGLTENIGAAIKFHRSFSEHGSVFIIDRHNLPHKAKRIEYSAEFADENPGVYARVDPMDEFEIRDHETGKLIGAGYFQSGSDTAIVNKWTKRVRNRMDDFHFEDEAEMIVSAGEVDFSNALYGTATYCHTDKAVGGSVQGALNEFDAYKMSYGSRHAEDITRMDTTEMATALRNMIANNVAGTGLFSNHHTVLYDGERTVRDETERIDAEDFIVASDGRTVYDDVDSFDTTYLGWS